MFNKKISFVLLFSYVFSNTEAQNMLLTEKSCIETALQNNLQIKIADFKIEKQQKLKGSTVNLPNLEILIQAPDGKNFRPGFMQGIEFPTVYTSQNKAQKVNIKVAEAEKGISTNILIYNVRTSFNELKYATEKFNILKSQDSIFAEILNINEVRYRVGQISNLEKLNGEAYYKQIQFNKMQSKAELQNSKIQLSILMGKPNDTTYNYAGKIVKIIDYQIQNQPDTNFASNPITNYYIQQKSLNKSLLKVEQNKRIPGLMFGFLNQAESNTALRYYFSAGVRLPIWYWAYGSKISAAKKDVEIINSQSQYANYAIKGEYTKELALYKQFSAAVDYYENIGLAQSNEIIRSAKESYRLGSIGYYVYLQNINQAFQIQLSYIESLKNHNKSVLALQYLLGNQVY